MQVDEFSAVLARHGITRGAGVPCSFFTPLVNHMTVDPALDYVSATSEGEAVAIAAGMTAAGSPAFALMQNSGLGNAVNPVTSLLDIYQIPVVLLVSHRGEPGIPDEPQHEVMGRITEQLAALCELRTHVLDPATLDLELTSSLRDSAPTAFICRQGTLTGGPLLTPPDVRLRSATVTPERQGEFEPRVSREAALHALLPVLNRGLDDATATPAAVIATTGKMSRELFELDDQSHDRRNRFYMVGSMGCATGFGVGVARAQPDRPVVVLDGDGSLLMKLGSLATAGSLGLENLHHVVLDNGAHDSTGGQPTPSPAVDFASMALACGYRHADTASDPGTFADLLLDHLGRPGPTLLRLAITTGARSSLGRPDLTPRAGYLRFRDFLAEPVA